MNKADLINHIVAETCLTKADASRALDATLEGITKTLRKGDVVTLTGFGAFSVGKRTARIGRNPATGEEIKIPASKTPKFKAGKSLKDAVA
ncbi:DNA-binding protein HU [Burkholderia savannae]|uniref:DNA-binding protein HU n=1 Tax=Burkholderia savannae TaxID=1637837 RepID=A0ABR5TFJ8_9BURK|nr:HU family DNA-binding protein [Burkholderia savannae]KWZ43772.1 DNA-binding protein HU [Burkholderia savannae]